MELKGSTVESHDIAQEADFVPSRMKTFFSCRQDQCRFVPFQHEMVPKLHWRAGTIFQDQFSRSSKMNPVYMSLCF